VRTGVSVASTFQEAEPQWSSGRFALRDRQRVG